MPQLLTVREASEFASRHTNKNVTPPKISHLINYGRITNTAKTARFWLIKMSWSAITFLTSMRMKNYLYYFEFFSGLYEAYFFRQVSARDERDAIIQIVSFFTDRDEDETEGWLYEELGSNWSVEQFWEKMDMHFQPADGMVGYNLLNFKEIKFDLNRL